MLKRYKVDKNLQNKYIYTHVLHIFKVRDYLGYYGIHTTASCDHR